MLRYGDKAKGYSIDIWDVTQALEAESFPGLLYKLEEAAIRLMTCTDVVSNPVPPEAVRLGLPIKLSQVLVDLGADPPSLLVERNIGHGIALAESHRFSIDGRP